MTNFAQQPLDALTAAGDAGEQQLLELEAALDSVLSIRYAQRSGVDPLERRIALLRSDQIDRDLLEERARVMLGRVHKNDLVIITGP